jgi:hypothetical protein
VDDRPWQGPAPPAVAYVFATGRSTEAIVTQLGDRFAGVLQVDGYGAYKALIKRCKPGRIRLAFCLAHARRKFVAVHKTTQSPAALQVLQQIAAIYAIEERIRGSTAEQRRAVREAESRPLMNALKRRLTALLEELSVKSTLAKAIRYTLGHWDGLAVFLGDGRVEIDSNIGAADALGLQLHQAVGSEADHLAQEVRVRAVDPLRGSTQQLAKRDLVLGHRGDLQAQVVSRQPTLTREHRGGRPLWISSRRDIDSDTSAHASQSHFAP